MHHVIPSFPRIQNLLPKSLIPTGTLDGQEVYAANFLQNTEHYFLEVVIVLIRNQLRDQHSRRINAYQAMENWLQQGGFESNLNSNSSKNQSGRRVQSL